MTPQNKYTLTFDILNSLTWHMRKFNFIKVEEFHKCKIIALIHSIDHW